MSEAKDPSEHGEGPEDPFAPGQPPQPYWPPPSGPIGPPQEQIPLEQIPPHWQQPYGPPSGPPAPQQWGGWAGDKPNNYLGWAVASTLLFCLPLGVASIYYATRVNSRWQAGDVAGAKDASERARKFAIASAVLGVIGLVLLLALGQVGPA
jgi:hypothetical protein